jgi:CPA2 family monovalent cation:H+ antiporter-2
MILSESELSQRAAQETLPLRDAFAVLFFVSVGMLVDPMIVVREPLPLLSTLLIIVLGKSIAAFFIVRMFGYPTSHALTISASLAQIGEFSFILAGLGVGLGLLPERARDLILAGAIISILLNPVLFAYLDRYLARSKPVVVQPGAAPDTPDEAAETASREEIRPTTATNHVVLIGFGRVGRIVSSDLGDRQVPLLLIEETRPAAQQAREAGHEVIHGNAADPNVIRAANLEAARCLLVAIPDAFEGGQVVAQARAINPALPIIARSHSDEETEHLMKLGATKVIMGEHEIAIAMLSDVPAGRSCS